MVLTCRWPPAAFGTSSATMATSSATGTPQATVIVATLKQQRQRFASQAPTVMAD